MSRQLLRLLDRVITLACCHASLISVSSHAFAVKTEVTAVPKHTPLWGARLIVVAAHHDEDLQWLDNFAQNCTGCHVYVYTSSQERAERTFRHGTIRQVPNVGREWGKYLRFIIDEWSALSQSNAVVAFLHAHLQANGVDDQDRGDLKTILPRWPALNRTVFLHGAEVAISIGMPSPVDYGTSILEMWPRMFAELGTAPRRVKDDIGDGASLDIDTISGAEFSVPAPQIVRRSLGFYERLEQWLITRKPSIANTTAGQQAYGITFDYAAGSVLELMAFRIFAGTVPVNLDSMVLSCNHSLLVARPTVVTSSATGSLRGSMANVISART